MSFWKKWWKKKNKDKKGAEEYEDAPLPTETIFADNDIEKRIRARRNNLSVSRSGRYKAKTKERLQLSDELYNKTAADSVDDYNRNHSSEDDYKKATDTETANKGQAHQTAHNQHQQRVH